MRMRFFRVLVLLAMWAGLPAGAASFDCTARLSVAEQLICDTPDVSAADDELAVLYKQARSVANGWPDTYEGGQSAGAWYKANSRAAWKWREANCTDADCLRDWFARRIAMMRWMVTSSERLGTDGLVALNNLSEGAVLVSFGTGEEVRNVVLHQGRSKFQNLPSGFPSVETEPLAIIVIAGHASAFENGDGFVTDLRVTQNGDIIDIGLETGATCFSKSEFVEQSRFTEFQLRLVGRDEICVNL